MKEVGQEKALKQLKAYRKEIDKLDDQIIKLLGKRVKVVNKVAALKVKSGIPSFIINRVIEVIERATKVGVRHGVSKEFIRDMYRSMIMHACILEEDLMKKQKKAKSKKK